MQVDNPRPAPTARGASPSPTGWRRITELAGYGIAGASNRRGAAKGALTLLGIGFLTWSVGLYGIWPGSAWLGLESVPDGWHLVTLVAMTSTVLILRNHPFLALGAGAVVAAADAAMGGSLGVIIVLWELLFGIGLSGSAHARQVVTSAVVTMVVGGFIAALIAESSLQVGIITGLQLVAMLGLPLWWASNVRQKTELAEMEAQRAADLERIGELRRVEAVRAERNAIARDLHDAIASRMSTIAIQSAAALATPERDQGAIMRTVRTQSLEALQEMRSMIVVLRSEPDPPAESDAPAKSSPPAVVQGGLAHVEDLVSAARASGLRVKLDVPDQWADVTASVPVAVGQASYRIVQEALANAAKHAPESDVRVTLSGGETRVRVGVENSITSSTAVDHPTLSAGTGLAIMRERAEALGGRFFAGRDETATVWSVAARFPIPARGRDPSDSAP